MLNGAFNILTKQFLGDDPQSYLIRDDDRTVVVWGQLNPATGEFIATRNPIRYAEGGVKYDIDLATGTPKMTGIEIDSRVDYRGSKFFDEAYMQRGKDGAVEVKDALAYAAHLSSQAKTAKLAAGDSAEFARTTFFELPEKAE